VNSSKFCSKSDQNNRHFTCKPTFFITTLVTSSTWLPSIVIDNKNHREYSMAIEINRLISYCKSHEYLKLHVTDKFNKINMAVGSDKSKTADVSVIEILLESSVVLNLLVF
jgi:hypothetical protein